MLTVEQHRDVALAACRTGNTDAVAWTVWDVRRDHGDEAADDLIQAIADAGYPDVAASLAPGGDR